MGDNNDMGPVTPLFEFLDRAKNTLAAFLPRSDGAPSFIQNEDRRSAESAAAFAQVFGHVPQNSVDRMTAEALNPNTYDPKYKGVQAQIRVVRIDKVPGQGVVRSSFFIEQDRVFNPSPNNLGYNRGDGRTANENFDPELSRVTMYVDFENGLVILRQNPSIKVDDGEVEVGTPEAKVWQAKDGSVRVNYAAHDPFAVSVHKNVGSVNGNLVFTPGQGVAGKPGSTGVTVNGRVGDYPTLEVYQDAPNGNRHTILIDPADSGSEVFGPMTLVGNHDIGTGLDAIKPFQKWKPFTTIGGMSDEVEDLPSAKSAPVGSAPKAPVYASGGDVSGPGSSIGDKIPAWLSDGEFVMNARSTSVNRPFLQALNADPYFLQKMLASRSERGRNESGGSGFGNAAPTGQPATVNISMSSNEDIVGRLKVLALQWELAHS
ncbi:hypothetical protein ACFYT3_07795 [Nocardia amikacinitolerans]|uniref:hypothetical protein n=1 Tax=Nocardia amikacinitolerans TaxID=756689 RepID=UPI0036C7E29D